MKTIDIENIRIADFDYSLPDERIPRHPMAQRDACKMLLSRPDGEIEHRKFSDLPEILPSDTLMVCNDTRVINARIRFEKSTGSKIEVFLLEPLQPSDYVLMFQSRRECRWGCLVGNLKRWKELPLEKILEIDGKKITLKAEKLNPLPGNGWNIRFSWDDDEVTFASVVDAAGYIPIPPYLKRESESTDADDYQTVYARVKGSVAAPTAGLHFTDELFSDLRRQGVELAPVTLHVGAGTFQPVKSETIGEHPMHTEVFTVSRDSVAAICRAKREGRHIAAVGTTSVRTIESLPYIGARILAGDYSMNVCQWDPYSEDVQLSADGIRELDAIVEYMDKKGERGLTGSTSIMIAPGFEWRVADILITNFHQPQSTLLLLVSAFLNRGCKHSGEQWRKIYKEALACDYRFLSYGDGSILFPKDEGVRLPGSKSMAARALVIDHVAGRKRQLPNLPDCDDTRELREALSQLDAGAHEYNLGTGATSLRFFLALAAATPGFEGVIDCSDALRRRPIAPLIETLRRLGADIRCLDKEGYPPMMVKGRTLAGGRVEVDGSISSQYASALLMVAPLMEHPLELDFQKMVSMPYLEMTRSMIQLGDKMKIEPDWSAASYFYELALLMPGRDIRICELQKPAESLQGDSRCAMIFESLGVSSQYHSDGSATLRGDASQIADLKDKGEFAINLSEEPDLVPALVVGLAEAGIRFNIMGVGHLRYKETDRLGALREELGKLGYLIEVGEDNIRWNGEKVRVAGEVVISAHGDHRMAMAFSIAAKLRDDISIEGKECVSKSFPDFYIQLNKV